MKAMKLTGIREMKMMDVPAPTIVKDNDGIGLTSPLYPTIPFQLGKRGLAPPL